MASAGFEPADLGARGQHANHQTTEAITCQYNIYTAHLA